MDILATAAYRRGDAHAQAILTSWRSWQAAAHTASTAAAAIVDAGRRLTERDRQVLRACTAIRMVWRTADVELERAAYAAYDRAAR